MVGPLDLIGTATGVADTVLSQIMEAKKSKYDAGIVIQNKTNFDFSYHVAMLDGRYIKKTSNNSVRGVRQAVKDFERKLEDDGVSVDPDRKSAALADAALGTILDTMVECRKHLGENLNYATVVLSLYHVDPDAPERNIIINILFGHVPPDNKFDIGVSFDWYIPGIGHMMEQDHVSYARAVARHIRPEPYARFRIHEPIPDRGRDHGFVLGNHYMDRAKGLKNYSIDGSDVTIDHDGESFANSILSLWTDDQLKHAKTTKKKSDLSPQKFPSFRIFAVPAEAALVTIS